MIDLALIPVQRLPMAEGFAQGQINRLISRGVPISLDDLDRG